MSKFSLLPLKGCECQCKVQNAGCRLQTKAKLQTEGKMQTVEQG